MTSPTSKSVELSLPRLSKPAFGAWHANKAAVREVPANSERFGLHESLTFDILHDKLFYISVNEISFQEIMENISETVNKAIDILEIFLQKDGEFSLAEISTFSKFNKATAYRLVSTLVKRGFVNQPKKNGKYSLGLKALDFTFAIRKNFKFVDLAYLYLSRLSKSHISAYISVLDADSSLVIEEVAVVDMMRINSPIGKRMPLHATACGRVLLSALSTEERASFYRRANLKTFTCKTRTDLTNWKPRLKIYDVMALLMAKKNTS